MRRLIASINVTLDGCCDHTQVVMDEDHRRYATALVKEAGGVLFGRVTYELFASYWPLAVDQATPDREFARAIDAKPKFVFSQTLAQVGWRESMLVRRPLAEAVTELKRAEGPDLISFGSPGLLSELLGLGLVDELHLVVQPILAGRGPTLFEGKGRLRLQLLEARPFSSGVVLHRYAV